MFRSFVAGVLATLREFTLLYAPNVNSYKRYQPGSFAPTAIAWGEDNRTCALRVVGHGPSLRVENRVPGGDVNPYLALAGMLAGGLFGVRDRPRAAGRADRQRLRGEGRAGARHAARGARHVRDSPTLARSAFGDDVVDHYVRAAGSSWRRSTPR